MEERFNIIWKSDNNAWCIVKDNKNNKYELRNHNKVIVDYVKNKEQRPFYYYDKKIPNYIYKKVCEVVWNEI